MTNLAGNVIRKDQSRRGGINMCMTSSKVFVFVLPISTKIRMSRHTAVHIKDNKFHKIGLAVVALFHLAILPLQGHELSTHL
jgi:hypothetical protein